MEQLEQLRHYVIPKFYHFKVLFLENARMQKKKKGFKAYFILQRRLSLKTLFNMVLLLLGAASVCNHV